ncbi:MAG: FAD-dependent oxidoreductase [Deltaproteobacteria bacterium]|jgi:ribulose 1,5-bisphosphate synthetase/thiazole synthase|nr:FAD-dependent oxidoreductase [Deltaproteobacteria bacterium]
MKQVKEAPKIIDVMAETDILVVGSGPAGLAAAVSAARTGVKTMLVDRYGCFGGAITQVGVGTMAWYRYEGTVDTQGIGIEFEQRAKEMGASNSLPQSRSEVLDAEMFKYVADSMVQEAGIEPLLHSTAVDAVMEANTIKGIIIESKSGRQAILAKRVVDATGDADIAYLAGAPCHKTPKKDMMGVTVMFSCAGVNRERFLEYVVDNLSTFGDWGQNWEIETTGKEDDLLSAYLEEPFNRAREAGLIPKEMTSIGGSWSSLTDAGEAPCLNMIYMLNYDATDVRDLTRAEMDGRHQAVLAIEALKKFVPGFENAKLRNYGMTLGVRDTRKIVGRYNLTEQDVRNQARFEDSIGIFPEFMDGYGVLALPTTGRYFQVPYGILVSEKVENLLVAGRCVAGDRISHAAVRSMMCCTVTGQGAGVAAAVSINNNVSCSEVDIQKVQKALRKQDVRIL